MTDRERWNQKYQNRKLKSYKSGPSKWLLEHEDLLQKLPKGKGLDIASGFGRNSFYLEKMGFHMDAVDVSDIAIDWMKEEAAKNKLNLSPYRLDLAEAPFPHTDYSLIICFNFLFRDLFPMMKKSLKSGGLLFYETVYSDDTDILGNKMNPDYILEKNELLQVFHDFRIRAYREKVVETATGKQKALASIVVEK